MSIATHPLPTPVFTLRSQETNQTAWTNRSGALLIEGGINGQSLIDK